ncbi:DUF4937 domain-containing protein [Shewanella electrodiphila]|uniref:DUF4937 domain-containing protein n=1 Tax=Shewanella electrodiphila TaxID=934143 RepID=A0ABT0KPX6_9GAMM|nr:DUF4937 domain-containing protein [Shewanella electrodiphila]MCL1045902.1 DUF4937 domain-containing protein [Shewanella electrodiphila]
MTLAKIISCKVTPSQINPFSHCQSQWGLTATCNGFLGQFGGWVNPNETSEYQRAIIIALWQSQAHLTAFMQSVHDDIIEHNLQGDTYLHCQVKRQQHVMSINSNQLIIPKVNLIRVAYCNGVIDKQKFIRDQQQIWNPGMHEQAGFLGGDVWQEEARHKNTDSGKNEGINASTETNYVVVTYWASEQAHLAYLNNTFPRLKSQVNPLDYIKHISGDTILVERKWDVLSSII